MKIEYAEVIKWVKNNHPDRLHEFLESLSPNQIKCKKWVAQELESLWIERQWEDLHIEQIGGWCGWPLLDFIKHLPIESYRNVDMDPFAIQVFNRYKHHFDFPFEVKGIEEDIKNLNVSNSPTAKIRIVINTSCEHMEPLPKVLENRGYNPEKAVFFLQSNNLFDEPTHINCVNSVEELIEQNKLSKVFFAGEKDLGRFKRFMVVGKWK